MADPSGPAIDSAQVRKFAKSGDPAIAKAAEEVVESWKEAVKREQAVEHRRSSGSGATNQQPKSGNPESACMSQGHLNKDVSTAGDDGAEIEDSQTNEHAAQAGIPARRESGAQTGPSQSPVQPSAAETEGAARPGAARPAANAAGMVPPKTGVPARDKMRQLLADALTMALPDVRGGEPGTATCISTLHH